MSAGDATRSVFAQMFQRPKASELSPSNMPSEKIVEQEPHQAICGQHEHKTKHNENNMKRQ